ncbi:hypothetical protein [Streptomyces hawaiiensis]|uniref:hypothetical protein n=1 Tax=Streptomyces hawaiiensis TaxID=67305 RepID=UPI00364BF68C
MPRCSAHCTTAEGLARPALLAMVALLTAGSLAYVLPLRLRRRADERARTRDA